MVQVIMARHGETPYNAQKKICGGGSDPALTANGVQQAVELGTSLKSYSNLHSKVYCSHLVRSHHTASLAFGEFKEKSFEIIQKRGLREIDHGVSEGIPAAERKAEWEKHMSSMEAAFGDLGEDAKWTTTPYERAETFAVFGERVASAVVESVREAAKDGPDKTVAFVTHNAVMQVLIMNSLRREGKLEKGADGAYPMFFELDLLKNCEVATFECDLSEGVATNMQRIRFIPAKV